MEEWWRAALCLVVLENGPVDSKLDCSQLSGYTVSEVVIIWGSLNLMVEPPPKKKPLFHRYGVSGLVSWLPCSNVGVGLSRRDIRLSSCIIKTILCVLGKFSYFSLHFAHHNRRKVGGGWRSGAHSFEAFLAFVSDKVSMRC